MFQKKLGVGDGSDGKLYLQKRRIGMDKYVRTWEGVQTVCTRCKNTFYDGTFVFTSTRYSITIKYS